MSVNVKTGNAFTKVEEGGKTSLTKEVIKGTNIPPDKMAKVTVCIGVTRSTAPYESLRVDMGLELPCHVDKLDETHEQVVDWLDTKMTTMLEQV